MFPAKCLSVMAVIELVQQVHDAERFRVEILVKIGF